MSLFYLKTALMLMCFCPVISIVNIHFQWYCKHDDPFHLFTHDIGDCYKLPGRKLEEELTRMGVFVMAEGRGTLAEEMPYAYKNVADVVGVMERAGIARRVARLKPVGVMKG